MDQSVRLCFAVVDLDAAWIGDRDPDVHCIASRRLNCDIQTARGITGNVHPLDIDPRNRLNEDTLPDASAWGVEDMTGVLGLLSDFQISAGIIKAQDTAHWI